jgi:hypothetical protein
LVQEVSGNPNGVAPRSEPELNQTGFLDRKGRATIADCCGMESRSPETDPRCRNHGWGSSPPRSTNVTVTLGGTAGEFPYLARPRANAITARRSRQRGQRRWRQRPPEEAPRTESERKTSAPAGSSTSLRSRMRVRTG